MKNTFLVIGLILSISQVFGQTMVQQQSAELQAIELNEVHEMVKNLADSIAVNYIDGKKAHILKEKLLTELQEGKLNSFNQKQALAKHLSEVLKT